MRTALVVVLGLSMVVGLAMAQQPAQQAPPMNTLKDKVSYVVGLSIAGQLKQDGMDVDFNTLVRGMQDGISGAKPALSPEEIQQVMQQYEQQEVAAESDKNIKAGQEAMAANKNQPGVQSTASGLQYKVLKQGNGASPQATDTVTTHYQGSLLNGNVFDSSYQRGQPASFPLNRVIKGWTEVLQLMKVGDKFQVWIPPDLAYGADGHPPVIGANATLVFEIELLGIGEPTK